MTTCWASQTRCRSGNRQSFSFPTRAGKQKRAAWLRSKGVGRKGLEGPLSAVQGSTVTVTVTVTAPGGERRGGEKESTERRGEKGEESISQPGCRRCHQELMKPTVVGGLQRLRVCKSRVQIRSASKAWSTALPSGAYAVVH